MGRIARQDQRIVARVRSLKARTEKAERLLTAMESRKRAAARGQRDRRRTVLGRVRNQRRAAQEDRQPPPLRGSRRRLPGQPARLPVHPSVAVVPRLCRRLRVSKSDPDIDFRGDLQVEVMNAVWKLGQATVDDVRDQQPKPRRSAYTTVQTVLNRLVERGLLTRSRNGRAFVYRAKLGESEFLARSIGDRLAGATPEARRAALVNLFDELEPGEVDELARRANQVRRARGKR